MKKHASWSHLLSFLASTWLVPWADAQWTPQNPVRSIQQQPDGALFVLASGFLKVEVGSGTVIPVLYSPSFSFPKKPEYVVIRESWPATKGTMKSSDAAVTLSTARLKIVVTKRDSAINFADANGNSLVQEASRKLTPVKVNGEDTYRARNRY
jgi:hypothetical protein